MYSKLMMGWIGVLTEWLSGLEPFSYKQNRRISTIRSEFSAKSVQHRLKGYALS